jgi:hypothetical protein
MPTNITTGALGIAIITLKRRIVTLFTAVGTTLSGWVNNGATLAPKGSGLYPAFEVTGGHYAYYNIGSLTRTTITFDVYITGGKNGVNLCNFVFGATTAGSGYMIRFDARSGNYSGITTISNWQLWNYPRSGPTLKTNTWYSVKLQILNASTYAWYLNGTFQSNYTGAPLPGTCIAIHGDSATAKVNGGYFRNITIVNSIV